MNCTLEEQNALEQAALAHHLPSSCETAMRNKFLHALGIAESSINDSLDSVREILLGFHRRSSVNSENLKLAGVVELANALDERLEWEPFAAETDEENPDVEAAFKQLQAVAGCDIEKAIHAMPPLPTTVQQSLNLLFRGNAGVGEVEAIATSEPILEAELLRTANLDYRSSRRSRVVSSAIKGMGVQTALSVICAASLRSLFIHATLHRVWNHGLGVAQIAERLARATDQVDPCEAFVAGLLHDIGRLPMASLPGGFQQRFARVFRKGCEPVLIERVFCASTHGDAGARLLRNWNLPLSVSMAVEHHHEPERSNTRLAALVCVADDPLGIREDLPSVVRRRAALNDLNLSSETLANSHHSGNSALDTLRFVA